MLMAMMIVEIVHQLEHIQQTVRRHPKVYIIMVVAVVTNRCVLCAIGPLTVI